MEYLKILPSIVFVFTLIISKIYKKAFYLTIPALIISLFAFGDKLIYLQIILTIIWIIYVIGNKKVSAFQSFTESNLELRESVKTLWMFVPVLLFIGYFFLIRKQLDSVASSLTITFAFVLLTCSVLYGVIYYSIAPLFVRKEEEITANLENYYKTIGRSNGGHFIKFEDDPISYKVDIINFNRFKDRIGTTFSYTKYTCAFGVKCIGNINYNENEFGKSSEQDEDLKNDGNRRTAIFGMLFFVIFAGIVSFMIMLR